jgi:hypothetical protein
VAVAGEQSGQLEPDAARGAGDEFGRDADRPQPASTLAGLSN